MICTNGKWELFWDPMTWTRKSTMVWKKNYDNSVSEVLGMCSSELLKGKNYINSNIFAFYDFKVGFQYTPQSGFTLLLPQFP